MEEKKLELRLGPPGDDQSTLISMGYYISSNSYSTSSTTATCGTKRGLINTLEVKTGETRNWLTNSKSTGPPANTVVPNSYDQKRMAIDTVVGWPPIGSFRKNLSTSSSSKGGGILMKSTDEVSMDSRDRRVENLDENSLYVKIHMDGVPIGRKIDLKSYDNYEKLSSAVDELFRCLLAATQKNHHYCAKVGEEEMVETKGMISTGLLDGSGEYTLVYEDNEGDRMLVGDDVPWHMFVSTAKRLRVLKRSEIPSLQEMRFKSQSGLILLHQRHEEDRVNPK